MPFCFIVKKSYNIRPIFTSRMTYLPPLLFDRNTNEGFSIKEIVTGYPQKYKSGALIGGVVRRKIEPANTRDSAAKIARIPVASKIPTIKLPVISTSQLVKDDDSKSVGIGITKVSDSDDVGLWKYQKGDDSSTGWDSLGNIPDGKILLLSESAKLKFESTQRWNFRDALKKANIQVMHCFVPCPPSNSFSFSSTKQKSISNYDKIQRKLENLVTHIFT